MWHVILQILAVLGIIILCILGLVLLVLALILFVPIRYRVSGSKSAETFFVRVRASYLLHLVTLHFDYPESKQASLRVFGRQIAVFPQEDTASEAEEAAKDTASGTKAEAAKDGTSEAKAEVPKDRAPEAKAEAAKDRTPETRAEVPEGAASETGEGAKDAASVTETETETSEDEASEAPVSGAKKKKTPFLKKCIYTIRGICDKIREIAENISYYKDVLTAAENRLMYNRLLVRLKKVLKSICPRKLRARILAGTGSPDTTGYLCALYGLLLPKFGRQLDFTADFENKVFEGDFRLKGGITLYPLLLQAGKIYFDRQLRTFLKELKREEE